MKGNSLIFIILLCFAILVIHGNASLQSNMIVFSGTGKFLEPIHGEGRNYTWVTVGRAYGDIQGQITWFEEGFKTNIEGQEYSSFKGWVNGTLKTDDGKVFTYELGKKGGDLYTYQCLWASNAEECLKDGTKCRFRSILVTGPLYINGEYVKYYITHVYGIPGSFIIPY